MITVKISDLLSKVQELIADGHQYVELSILEADELDGEILPPSLHFSALTEFENEFVDFEEIDEINPFIKQK